MGADHQEWTQDGHQPFESPGLKYWRIAVVLTGAVGLYFTSFFNFLVFHSIVELFSVAIAWGVFAITWNSRHEMRNNCLLLLGISYFFIGNLDLLHTLAYKGMKVFSGSGANLPTQLWIAARYVQSLSYLLAPFFLGRALYPRLTWGAYAVVFVLLLLAIFRWELFPACYVEGQGQTAFKIASEYAISAISLFSLFVLFRKRQFFDPRVWRLVSWSVAATIASEMSFTFYIGVYDLSNLVGHYFKIVAFCLIYKAIIQTGLKEPYRLIFQHLRQTQEALQRAHDDLERQVKERTKELVSVNAQCLQEIAERKRVEATLRESEEQLRHLHSQLLKAQEQEREHISRELHDDLGQSLIVLKMNLRAIGDELARDPEEAAEKLDSLWVQLSELIEKVRHISRTLTPPILEHLGLEAALDNLVGEFAAAQNLKFSVHMEEVSPALSKMAQLTAYRIFQEALTNISKHAAATEVTIRVSRDNGRVNFSISDNGQGFDLEEVKNLSGASRGLGLASLTERVRMLHGTSEIWSQRGQGTRLRFSLPEDLPAEAANLA